MKTHLVFPLLLAATALLLIGAPVEKPLALKPPTITAALEADPAAHTGPCPAVITFKGAIRVMGITKPPLTLTYEFIRSDGARDTQPKTLTFLKDGSQPIGATWTLGGEQLPSYSGWMAVRIAGTPPVESNRARFSIQCQAASPAGQTAEPQIKEVQFAQFGTKRIASPYTKVESDRNRLLPGVKKVDLVCTVTAYTDRECTTPVQIIYENQRRGRFHLSPAQNPQRPLPYRAYFRVEVKNVGWTMTASRFKSRIEIASIGWPPICQTRSFDTAWTEALAPGEAVQFDIEVGPIPPTNQFTGRGIWVAAFADILRSATEDVENNNSFSFQLDLVWP